MVCQNQPRMKIALCGSYKGMLVQRESRFVEVTRECWFKFQIMFLYEKQVYNVAMAIAMVQAQDYFRYGKQVYNAAMVIAYYVVISKYRELLLQCNSTLEFFLGPISDV